MWTCTRKQATIICLALSFLIIFTPIKAQTDYPTYVFNFIELKLVQEESTSLLTSVPLFASEPELVTFLSDEDVLFWEHLGPFDNKMQQNTSISSFAFVRINETGFFETIIGLSPDNHSLLWIEPLSSVAAENFTSSLNGSIEFFTNQDKYWGLCEEILVLPGSIISSELESVWRYKFYLIESSELWTLYTDSMGHVLDADVTITPCVSCTVCPILVILGFTSVVVVVLIVISIKSGWLNRT